MEEIILTGYDKKTFKRLVRTDTPGGCYFCKRAEQGVFVRSAGDERAAGDIELHFAWYPIVEDKRIFKYLVCDECFKILKDFVRKMLFGLEFKQDFDLEWGTRKEGGQDV
jgi:hypothetical protein